jgi:asparagine synthase (glutamine-hydrolysing)
MCGICGILDHQGRPIDPSLVDGMRDAMSNRGPDDAGTRVLPLIVLGHRRLSIIDLSPRGAQPMSNEDGSVWLVFNGEIYDFEPLRAQLIELGHLFTSDSDSEVLVHGYEAWGIDGLASRLNGMFAFGLWDSRVRELHLVRDRLGKKPLFYGWHAGRFVFASELKALWMLSPGGWKVRPESVARFLYWTYVPGRETIYQDLYQLLPARILTVKEGGIVERRYWRLSFANKVSAPSAEILHTTDAMLTAAVRRRLRSDVPLGAFLSGGVDSGYVVSRMAATAAEPIRTFSMGTRDAFHDERQAARRVAAYVGSVHTEFEVTPEAWDLLPRLVWEFGQPFADPACIPTYYVAQHARRHVTVALTGDGGDETFAGYSHHLGQYIGAMVGHAMPSASIAMLMRGTSKLLDGGGTSLSGSVARFLRYAHGDPMVKWAAASAWTLHHLPQLWRPAYRELASRAVLLDYALTVDADFDGTSALERAQHLDFGLLLPFCYNVKVDVATMMHGLEARCPFQDRDVVEWSARIPVKLKVRPWETKALLKRIAARWLPREFVYRPKRGFSLPMDAWFRGAWSREAYRIIFSDQARSRGFFEHEYLEKLWTDHVDGRASHGVRFWSLLWLEIWLQMFVDCTVSPESVVSGQESNGSTWLPSSP